MNRRSVLIATSLGFFFVLLSLFFVGVPWSSEIHEVPVWNGTGSQGVANSMFSTYTVTVILIALLLASAMIGGVYLAKMEGEERP
ncbi:MAG TPA: hypothetical protein VII27_00490 [Thermoplasmata archaeon]